MLQDSITNNHNIPRTDIFFTKFFLRIILQQLSIKTDLISFKSVMELLMVDSITVYLYPSNVSITHFAIRLHFASGNIQ